MTTDKHAELTPEAQEWLRQATDEWVHLPPSIIRKSVRDAFATLERLGLIEIRTLNTAPTAIFQWRAAPGGRDMPAQDGSGPSHGAQPSHGPQTDAPGPGSIRRAGR